MNFYFDKYGTAEHQGKMFFSTYVAGNNRLPYYHMGKNRK